MNNWFKHQSLRRTSAAEPLIYLRSVVKKYRGLGSTVAALKGVDLDVKAGEFLVVLGKSGAGKTTLVNMMTGIDSPTFGEVHVANVEIHTLDEGKRAAWRGRHMGVVLQFFQLLPGLTVLQNVMLPMDFAGRYPIPQQRERAMFLLEQMGIAEHAHKLPSAVSGGQQQRVAIARALANDPPILVADEPTGNLDSNTAQAVFDVFQTLVNQGKTVVMVTHDHDLARRGQRVIQLADGNIVPSGMPSGILPPMPHEELRP